jgi:glycine oxidase
VTFRRQPDVLVVGGGVIGCAVARALARPDRSVLLVERGAFGGQATCASAGVLAVASGDDEGARLALRRASLARWPALAAALADETGVDVGFERAGVLELSLDGADDARTKQARRSGQGFDARWLDAAAVREAAPATTSAALGGALFADDARVVPQPLVDALCESARRRGATLVPGAEVHVVESRGGRVVRVRAAGDWIEPGLLVVAAGAWSGCLPGVELPCEIIPARGQMLALRAEGPTGTPTVSHGGAYLVPRRSAEMLVGATVERAGFVNAVTPEGVAELLAHLERIAPAALRWPIVRMWAGLRPEAPAGGPWIGRHAALANVVVATGHHRNGILLAPVTADAVAALVDGVPPPAEAAPFGAA